MFAGCWDPVSSCDFAGLLMQPHIGSTRAMHLLKINGAAFCKDLESFKLIAQEKIRKSKDFISIAVPVNIPKPSQTHDSFNTKTYQVCGYTMVTAI